HRVAHAEGDGVVAHVGPAVAQDVLRRVREHPGPPGPRRGPGVEDGQAAGVELDEDELGPEAQEQRAEAAEPRRSAGARAARLELVQRVGRALAGLVAELVAAV